MNDMSSTIVAKSDQINAADLIGISKTITIREVKIKPGDDQPVSVYFEGDQKAFRPCKGVRRLMVRVWGPDAARYVGQSMTLFQDPTVTWAGKPEGGIRVSHMTGLSKSIVEPMRTSRAATKPYEIQPLSMEGQAQGRGQGKQTPQQWAAAHREAIDAATTLDELALVETKGAPAMTKLAKDHADLHAELIRAYSVRRAALVQEGRTDDQHGDQFADDADLPTDF